jgi:hypothetical protein
MGKECRNMAESGSAGEKPRKHMHQVVFIGYPKLLFMWPVILAGPVFYFLAPHMNPESLGWLYIIILGTCVLAIGIDVNRNFAVFWLVAIAATYFLGLWLRDAKQITVFGDIYRMLDNLNVQYDRGLGLALTIFLSVPYAIMLVWARLNDKWRITHNEFEHHSFGRMDDSLGRGAKRIRTSYPDLLELVLGLAGTLTVYDATGQRELRKIHNVMFLPLVRKKLDTILETTAVTQGAMEEEESV